MKVEIMDKFKLTDAGKKLSDLAKHPFDLTREGNLTPERIEKMSAEACGYRLLFATERVDAEVLEALEQLADERQLHQKMERMQSGEVMNAIEGHPSENRPVLHTALRDFFDEQQDAPQAKEARELALQEVKKLQAFKKLHAFKEMVMIAIGGSSLGPEAQYIAMEKHLQEGKRVHFISNVDPDDAASVLKKVNLDETVVVVVSKSGTTLETATNEAFVRDRFEKAGLNPKEHFIAVTSKGSPMDDPQRYLQVFNLWDWVGGRFSTSSMVGGVMLTYAFGFDLFWEFLKGAHAMDRAALARSPQENLPLLGALLSVWNHNFLGYPTLAMIPYSHPLRRYPAHVQQVEMESNGKRINKKGETVDFETGAIIWGEPGTCAQHSFFQLIHQGTAVIPMEMIGFAESQYGDDHPFQGTDSHQKLMANLFAQAIALATGKSDENPNQVFPGNRPSHILLGKKLTPFALGALLSYYEHKAAFEGFVWNINSFDQEGVQLGKVVANKLIDRFQGKGDNYPLGDAYLKQLKTVE